MRIRTARRSDALAIATVHVSSWQDAYIDRLPQTFLDQLSVERRKEAWDASLADRGDGEVFVADDGEVVGFISLGRTRDGDGPASVGEVRAIYVVARMWGRGVGPRLMQTGLAWLSARGYEHVTLWALASNERARRFYVAGGWLADDATRTLSIGGADVPAIRYRRSLP